MLIAKKEVFPCGNVIRAEEEIKGKLSDPPSLFYFDTSVQMQFTFKRNWLLC